MNWKQIGADIKAYRTARGLTLNDAAREAGVSASTISRLERGVSPNTLGDTFERVTRWAGLNNRLAAVGHIDRPLPDIVDQILAQDRHLDECSRRIIGGIFRAAYTSATGLVGEDIYD